MKFLVIMLFLIGFAGILEFSFAEMDYSQFLDYCDKSLGLLDSMTIEERLLTLLCDYIDSGFTEKHWIWLNGSNFDWNNFAQKASEEFARTIPEFINGGIEDTLVVDSWVSGRDSFPPPMGVTISFDYYDDAVIEHFEQGYRVHLTGNLINENKLLQDDEEKIIPPPLKQMNLGIKLGHIICDEDKNPTWNIHYKPACIFPDSEMELLKRGWAKLRLILPASGDPIKELEWIGQNEVTYRILGNIRVDDKPPPSTLDEKKEIVWEYAQKYHPGERFLEYSIPTSHMYHYNVGDKVQFDLLEWGNYSECWNLKLRIIDIHDQPIYEDNSVRFCLEPPTDGKPGWFSSYSMGQEFDEFVCNKAGYYRIEVSNGEIYPATILQNFVCFGAS